MSVIDSLADQVLAVDRALSAAGIAHAFGGALALAYCAEPRATDDIDINIALEPAETDRVLDALPPEIERDGRERDTAERDGQLRVWWGETAIDLFFGFHTFHHQLAARSRLVPFGHAEIPVIDGADLVVCKAMFDRSKDWTDIDSIAKDGRADLDHARRWLADLLGDDAPQVVRLDTVIAAHHVTIETDPTQQRPLQPPAPDLGPDF